MPRRNRRPRGFRQAPVDPHVTEAEDKTPDELAEALVARGLASPQVIELLPKPRRDPGPTTSHAKPNRKATKHE